LPIINNENNGNEEMRRNKVKMKLMKAAEETKIMSVLKYNNNNNVECRIISNEK
jgi:hypothetical protein